MVLQTKEPYATKSACVEAGEVLARAAVDVAPVPGAIAIWKCKKKEGKEA